MKADESKAFEKSLFRIMVANIVNHAEFGVAFNQRSGCAIEQPLQTHWAKGCLWHVAGWNSSKKLTMAKKLEKQGVIQLSQYNKGGVWSFIFTDYVRNQRIYELAIAELSKDDYSKVDSFPTITLRKQSLIDQIIATVSPCGQCPHQDDVCCQGAI